MARPTAAAARLGGADDSADHACRADAPGTHRPRGFGYGTLWWLLEKEPAGSPLYGAYMAWGVHGQYILVAPARSMVIAHKREVPVAGNWNVSWVGPTEFLRAARMLVTARCGAEEAG